jgi:hypothetical protein
MSKILTLPFILAITTVGCAGSSGESLDDSANAMSSARSEMVTCSSEGYHYASCTVGGDGDIVDARLVDQLSHPPGYCTQGASWGFTQDYIWVDHGCRAEFAVTVRHGGGGVRVIDATYGGNAGASYGNATNSVAHSCNGLYDCDYLVSVNVLGDPAYGHVKDFNVEWTCGDGGETQRAHIDAEANGVHVYLMCK